MASFIRVFCLFLLLFVAPSLALADPSPFDLAGPRLEVKVTHAGKTLPIAEVPNLSAGDQLWIKADLPAAQSVHYLLVAAFLRGATNPPPESWFYPSETWNQKGRGGLKITVPQDAQQLLVFLAPETGGDLKTLVGAVRGRPGAFVRASQDLNQAILDRSRLDTYLAAIRKINRTDPDQLKEDSLLLARSLAIKLDLSCLQKMPGLQASCLMQGQDGLVLSDGHTTSIVQALTSGSVSDLAMQLSFTPQAGFGYYSPYIASVMDIARIMDSFHTAQYQYIPALATEQGDQLSLELNTPPSFHNPKSVLVAALPAIEPPQMPPLHPVDPKQVYCAERTELVLPAEGAPLVFSTAYAHGMVLRLKGKDGKMVDLPVKADAEKGGFIADTAGLSPTNFDDALDGSLHGYWGFDPYNGPEFRLQNAHPQHWQPAYDQGDQPPLLAGLDSAVHLEAQEAACVESIMVRLPSGKTEKADWKSTQPNEVVITVPLKQSKPGALTLLVKQFGSKEADTVPLLAFAPAGHLDSFSFHAGDLSGVLKGSRLDEVKQLTFDGVSFKPTSPASSIGPGELTLAATDRQAAGRLKAGESAAAEVALEDGRILSLDTTVEPPRPSVALIGKSIVPAASSESGSVPPFGQIQLTGPNELPLDAQLTFSIHAQAPAAFPADTKVEVATLQDSFSADITLSRGLTLEDSHVALATLDAGKVFGPSAFGPIRFRIIEDGVAGDWQPLVTLVRVPVFHGIQCPGQPGQPCKLTGSRLFLVDSISNDPQFDHPIQVPEGFPGYVLVVPHPSDGQLYVKLHDDPSVVNPVAFFAARRALPPASAPASGTVKPPVGPLSQPSPASPSALPQSNPAMQGAGSHEISSPATPPDKPSSAQQQQPEATPATGTPAPVAPASGTPAVPAPAAHLTANGQS
jgi:hypothetical protein